MGGRVEEVDLDDKIAVEKLKTKLKNPYFRKEIVAMEIVSGGKTVAVLPSPSFSDCRWFFGKLARVRFSLADLSQAAPAETVGECVGVDLGPLRVTVNHYFEENQTVVQVLEREETS